MKGYSYHTPGVKICRYSIFLNESEGYMYLGQRCAKLTEIRESTDLSPFLL